MLFRWADSLDTPRADEMGRRGQRWRTGSRGRFGSTTPHFQGLLSVRKISPRRPISSDWGVSRLSAHVESTLSTLIMSDQTLGRARGGTDRYCMTDPGTPSRCEHRCEHLRHRPNLMSDQTSGAWRMCSLDGVTAWKCPGSLMPALTVSPMS